MLSHYNNYFYYVVQSSNHPWELFFPHFTYQNELSDFQAEKLKLCSPWKSAWLFLCLQWDIYINIGTSACPKVLQKKKFLSLLNLITSDIIPPVFFLSTWVTYATPSVKISSYVGMHPKTKNVPFSVFSLCNSLVPSVNVIQGSL